MAAVINTEYVFQWWIENFSYSWHKHNERLFSPLFIADGNTAWSLLLYPRGNQDKNFISVFLYRYKDGYPEKLALKVELSALAEDGSALISKQFNHAFTEKETSGYQRFIPMNELLLRKAEYLPQDTLRLCCKIWRIKENIQTITQIYAQTRFGIQQVSFLHGVENFSKIEPNEKKTVRHIYSNDKNITSSVYLTDGACCERKVVVEIMMEIKPLNTEQFLSRCQLSLLDDSGIALECGKVDNRFGDTTQNKLSLSLSSQDILSEKSKYLPDDKLSVLCECVFAIGVEYKSIERILHNVPPAAINQATDDCANYKSTPNEDLSNFPSAFDGLKDIYDNQFLTDLVLKTKTKSFPAHKIVLCAKSPVFKTLLSNVMREKITDCIQIDDLDEGTVQQLLLFLYSGYLKDLEWETATKLYYASDKYGIEILKALCSRFLKDNLSNVTAPELLLLADKYKDKKLKDAVEDFILKNEEKVFCSDEWEKLIETNPKLGMKTMHLKYKMKKINMN